MNQINSTIIKAKYKHLSNESIRSIIRNFNEFMTIIKAGFRATHKNHHLKVPRRNINKTAFLKELAIQHNTSLSNIYNIINSSKTTIIDKNWKDKIIYDPEVTINTRAKNKNIPNNSKLEKAEKFIRLVIDEVKSSKLKSIDEVINDLKINRKSEIAGMYTICTSTMYTYVKNGYLDLKPIDLPRMLRRRPKNFKRYITKHQRGTSIDQRPEQINDRSEFGHWEGDLVTGPRDGQNGAFLTLAERQTRFYYMIPIKNKKSKTVYMTINNLAKKFGPHFNKIFKSITIDTGLIKEIQLGINNKKRKILGYQSSESFFKKSVNLITNNTIINFYL